MDFEAYSSQLPVKKALTGVKLKILKRLWHEDTTPFPKPWVSSSELLELTQQSYFDRRTRELREQFGCDVESGYNKDLKDYAWRLRSSTLSTPQNRESLTKSQKNKLFEQYNFACAVCGKVVTPGLSGLQSDHKKPLSRGGSNNLDNWQPLCSRCNVGKRSACQDCELPCGKCSWAFPEVNGISVLALISNLLIMRLDAYALRVNQTRDQVITKSIEYYLDEFEKKD
jgi:HNH endonuclease